MCARHFIELNVVSSNTSPHSETSSEQSETQSRGSRTTRCDPSSQDPEQQTEPRPPPPAHPSGPYQTAAWKRSDDTEAARLTPGMILQRQGTILHIRSN